MSFGAVSTYVHALPFMCHLKGYRAPDLTHPQVRLAFKGVKRLCTRPPRRRDPVDLKLLKVIFKNVNIHSNQWLTFWTACITMFRCLLRISNVILSPHSIRVRDLKFTNWVCLVSIRSAKCSSPGIPHVIPLSYVEDRRFCAAFWLKSLISRCKLIGSDYLFCNHSAGLTYRSFRDMLSSCLNKLTLVKISSHSFRIGGASLLYNLGLPLSAIKERGGWRSWSVLSYLRDPIHVRIAREKKFCKVFSSL